MAKGSMRDQMPVVAAMIDEFRAVFGEANINAVIKAGMRGAPVFYATENGHTVGTPVPMGVRVGTDARGNRYLIDGPVPGEDQAVEISKYEARMQRERNQQRGK